LEKGTSTAINLGTGRGNSVREVIAAIEKVTKQKVPVRMAARRAGDPAQLVADPARAAKILNWKAKYSLDQIVSTAWTWVQKQLPARPS
jgi:UDP-glucose 4-epimerase